MDWRILHAINGLAARHPWLGHAFQWLEKLSLPVFAAATVALWLLARPGGHRRWKLACVSALAAAALGLLVNKVLAQVWDRQRPFVDHPADRVFGAHKADTSFPSDHASASFAIATAVLCFHRRVGLAFLLAAALVAVGRLVTGVHYPLDVLVGCLVGIASGLLVVRLARPLAERVVRLLEPATDRLLAPFWRLRRR